MVLHASTIANGETGNYSVSAVVGGAGSPANFLLENIGWYVSPTGNNESDCRSPATTCATINGVLGKTGFLPGDTVLVESGTYVGTGPTVVELQKSVRLLGGWNVSFTERIGLSTLNGQWSRGGMSVSIPVTAIVDHFQIRDCIAGSGGGIFINGDVTIRISLYCIAILIQRSLDFFPNIFIIYNYWI